MANEGARPLNQQGRIIARMKIWLPYVEAGSGVDVFTRNLARSLRQLGHEAVVTRFPHRWQYFPWRLRLAPRLAGAQLILANTWNGFCFKHPGVPLVAVEHLFVLDPALTPYKSLAQGAFHHTLVRYYERRSVALADQLVAVSRATAQALAHHFGRPAPPIIPNGIDVDFFCPPARREPLSDRPLRLLFVGNMSRRKGSDLLIPIIERLGPGFELNYTSGLRVDEPFGAIPGMQPLGRLDQEQVRDAYQRADILLFPTRLEGLPLVAMEAMACGTPVLAHRTSSLPEVVTDGIDGVLCPVNDVDAFVDAIRGLKADPDRLAAMGSAARATAEDRFCLSRMAREYKALFESLIGEGSSAPGTFQGSA